MANLQANLRSQFVKAAHDPGGFLTSVNQQLFENTVPSAYATLFFADYDPATGRLLYANCGHVPGLILRANGAVEELASNCTVLGLFEHWTCCLSSVELGVGDLIAIYTDGITESLDSREEEFGQSRLSDALRRHAELPAKSAVAGVIQDVLNFSPEGQFDDLTLIVARRRG